MTNLIHNNVDITTISHIVGHINSNVTLSVYAHEFREATVYGCNAMSELINQQKKRINRQHNVMNFTMKSSYYEPFCKRENLRNGLNKPFLRKKEVVEVTTSDKEDNKISSFASCS